MGASSVRAERVRQCARILGAAPRPWAAREGPGRVGAIGFCLFRLSHFSFKGETSSHIARSLKTLTPMVFAIAKHPRLALRCLDLISLGAVLEEESAGSRPLLLSPPFSGVYPCSRQRWKVFLPLNIHVASKLLTMFEVRMIASQRPVC